MFITTYNGSMQYKEILDDYIAHGNKNLSAEDEKAKEPHEALMSDFMALLASFSGMFYRLRGWEQQRKLLHDVTRRVDKKAAPRE